MSGALDRLRDALEAHKCEPTDKGKAKCPAHTDDRASLSFGAGEDGRALVHCYAGCEPHAIVEALGLNLADLMGEDGSDAGRPPGVRATWYGKTFTSAWTYRDAAGRKLGIVARYDGDGRKDIIPYFKREGDAWKHGAAPTPRPLYNLDGLAAQPDAPVFITEGEKCARAINRLAGVAVTSLNGAEAAGRADWTPLRGRRVTVWPDNDTPGTRYAADVARLAREAGAAEVKVLDVAGLGLPAGGDVVDYLAAHPGASLQDLEALPAGATAAADPLAALWRPVAASWTVTPPASRVWLLRAPDSRGGRGVLPRGKVGILAAEGGTGKTAALVGLGLAVVTGRPWMGYYAVPPTVAGRALLALAEEDTEEAHRRLWRTAEAYQLTKRERDEAASRLVVLPLAGHDVTLTQTSPTGLIEMPLCRDLRARLDREAGEDGWALIAVDPESRFAGGDIEGDNERATRFVEVLESFTKLPGNPTVLASAHSSKLARRQGQADVRGVTGRTDAARWVATLQRDREEVIFRVVKSNYTAVGDPLRLRWSDHVLRAVTGAEILDAATHDRNEQAAELDGDVQRIVGVLAREGTMTSRDSIAAAAHMKLTRGRAALDLAIARGLVHATGTDRHRTFAAVPEVCCTRPPHTPPPSGTDGRTGVLPSRPSWDGLGRIGTEGRIGDATATDRHREPGDDDEALPDKTAEHEVLL